MSKTLDREPKLLSDSDAAQQMLRRVLRDGEVGKPLDGIARLISLAKRLGAKDIVRRPLSVSGMLIPSSDGYVIAINQNDSERKQRYTLAHEIGHLVVTLDPEARNPSQPQVRCRAFNYGPSDIREERLCEAMAAELLMPTEAFGDWLDRLGSTIKNIPRLADGFRTSITATAIRYCEIIPEPCLLVKWRLSRNRNQGLAPDWQIRNQVAGPHVKLRVGPKNSFGGAGSGANSAFSEDHFVTTQEPMWTKVTTGRTWHVESPRYPVESMAFGRGGNRFAISVVYLNRTAVEADVNQSAKGT